MRLRALEDENRRLKTMAADQALDIQGLKHLCRVVGLAPATYYYRARRPEPVELREKLKVLAAQRPRWADRRPHVLLKREGHHVNHELAVERLDPREVAAETVDVLDNETTVTRTLALQILDTRLVTLSGARAPTCRMTSRSGHRGRGAPPGR